MMWCLSDQFKLALLLASWASCLMTMFTSHSFIRENGDLNQVHIPVQRFCLASRQAVIQACSNNAGGVAVEHDKSSPLGLRGMAMIRTATTTTSTTTTSLCAQRKAEAQGCESVIQKAERWINLGGCSLAIQAQSICEAEWCRGGAAGFQTPDAQEACHKECAVVRKKLEDCIQRNVSSQWKRSGLAVPTAEEATKVT